MAIINKQIKGEALNQKLDFSKSDDAVELKSAAKFILILTKKNTISETEKVYLLEQIKAAFDRFTGEKANTSEQAAINEQDFQQCYQLVKTQHQHFLKDQSEEKNISSIDESTLEKTTWQATEKETLKQRQEIILKENELLQLRLAIILKEKEAHDIFSSHQLQILAAQQKLLTIQKELTDSQLKLAEKRAGTNEKKHNTVSSSLPKGYQSPTRTQQKASEKKPSEQQQSQPQPKIFPGKGPFG